MKVLVRRIRQIWCYGAERASYSLLTRTLYAAWLVRRHLPVRQSSPALAAAIAAVEKLYLTPQPGWGGVEAETIVRFAGFVVGVPLTWGRCVQKSLIAYRLLNGYGLPARFCCGVNRENQSLAGHAWVELLSEPKKALGESRDPYQHYLLIYASPNAVGKDAKERADC